MALFLARNGQFAKRNAGAIGVQFLKATYSSDATSDTLPSVKLSSLKRGTGGRSSFNGNIVSVFGASGFLGRYIVNRLGQTGSQVILPFRCDPYDIRHLKLCGDLGQVLFHPFELTNEDSIRKAVESSNIVINLIGREWETRNYTLHDVNVDGAARIARICRESGIKRLIHFSALNASPNPVPHVFKEGSQFLKTKWLGEQAVLNEFPDATIVRPADIYGFHDCFIYYYSHVWRRRVLLVQKGLPLYKKGEHTVKQPVFAGDVSLAVTHILSNPETAGKIYQAVGPRRYVLSDLLDWMFAEMRRSPEDGSYSRYDIKYDPFVQFKIWFTSVLSPNKPFGMLCKERIERESVTDIVDPNHPTLEDLGVTLSLIEEKAPYELRARRAHSEACEEPGEYEVPPPPKYITVDANPYANYFK